MKSIIQNEQKCYICGCVVGLEVHHTWHGPNRKLADKDGLTVYLCGYCHRALHDHNLHDLDLMQAGERAWLEATGKPVEDFRERYGKNVL